MNTIIPNLHPIFVHFTVALISMAFLSMMAAKVVTDELKSQLLGFAHFNLYTGALFTLATVATGLYAFGTVNHDSPSHMAMTDHRNWALFTTALILLGALLVFVKRKSDKRLLPAVLLVLVTMVGITAFKGGELVYRYGLGVMSLPQSSGAGHDHQHGAGGMPDEEHSTHGDEH